MKNKEDGFGKKAIENLFKTIQILRLNKDLPMPTRAYPGDAGYDLRSNTYVILRHGERSLIPLGIKIALPAGYYAEIVPRSGLAAKYGITVVNSPGIIDNGYRGELFAPIINLGRRDFTICLGDRIVQLIPKKLATLTFLEVDKLTPTDRDVRGCGSTGR